MKLGLWKQTFHPYKRETVEDEIGFAWPKNRGPWWRLSIMEMEQEVTFSIKSTYKQFIYGGCRISSATMIWKSKCPLKVRAFLWLVTKKGHINMVETPKEGLFRTEYMHFMLEGRGIYQTCAIELRICNKYLASICYHVWHASRFIKPLQFMGEI